MHINRVLLDGTDVRCLDLEWLRSRFGYVSQVYICIYRYRYIHTCRNRQ